MSTEQYTQGGFRFQVYDSELEIIAGDDCIYDDCLDAINNLDAGINSAGDYYVIVRPIYTSWSPDGSYVLTASFYEGETAIEFEGNNSFEEAQEVELGVSYSGNLSSSADYDIYKFTLDEPGTVQLFMYNEEYTQGGFRFDLVNEDNYYRASDDCIYDGCVDSVNELRTEFIPLAPIIFGSIQFMSPGILTGLTTFS